LSENSKCIFILFAKPGCFYNILVGQHSILELKILYKITLNIVLTTNLAPLQGFRLDFGNCDEKHYFRIAFSSIVLIVLLIVSVKVHFI